MRNHRPGFRLDDCFAIFAVRDHSTEYWLDLCDYDIDTADALLSTGRYLYVGFMCHQVFEKALKAYWCHSLKTTPLKTHTLRRLAYLTGLIKELSDKQKILIDSVEPLNIECRYPEYKRRLSQKLNEETCKTLIANTKEFLSWIKARL